MKPHFLRVHPEDLGHCLIRVCFSTQMEHSVRQSQSSHVLGRERERGLGRGDKEECGEERTEHTEIKVLQKGAEMVI